MISAALSPAQRLYLDALRAGAAMMVLFGHTAHFFLPGSFLAAGWLQGLGVYLFFLISGFLISLSVFEKRHDPHYGFRAYFIDRSCRIYSAFLPALVLVVVLDGFIHTSPLYEWGRDFTPQDWFGNLLMLQDFPIFQILRRLGMHDSAWFIGPFGSARPFWTISIEWWIYMLFGGVVLIWLRRTRPIGRMGVLLLIFVAIEPAYHFVGGYDQCLTILWVVGMGVSLFWLHVPNLAGSCAQLTVPRLRRIALIVSAAAAFAIAGRLVSSHSEMLELQFGLSLGTFIFAVLFVLGLAPVPVPPSLARLAAFLAGYSYSLYLTHYTLLEFVAIRLVPHRDGPLVFWLIIAAANLFAMVFWSLFERHHRQLARVMKQRLAKPAVRGGAMSGAGTAFATGIVQTTSISSQEVQ
jgi:peptidoglycan/LPS O-acetylase OafA/YrhL